MKDIHTLFEEDIQPFQDHVKSLTHMVLSEEKLKQLFKAFPSKTQALAYNYGFKDNLFHDHVERFLNEYKLEELIK